ncbi:uncharacterized protein [Nicotiana sylvestris]|uniref:uncharacterized protein n=1 Tax=Nicotiana sylvestris TaxID=4096 RepID=UPI00388CC697
MALYEALYGRRCRSPVGWFESGEATLFGIDLVQDALDKVKVIQERLRTAQSRQKSYADRKVRDVSYMVGEKLDDDLTYDVEPVTILERQVRKLRSKDIASVKVQWEAAWETERVMRSTYPHLFEASVLSYDSVVPSSITLQ